MLLTSSFPNSSLQRVLWECARIYARACMSITWELSDLGISYLSTIHRVCAHCLSSRVPSQSASGSPFSWSDKCIHKGPFTGLEFPPKQTHFCIWDHSDLLSQTRKVLWDQALGLNYEGLDFLLQLGGEKKSMKRMSFKQKLLGNNLRGHWIFGWCGDFKVLCFPESCSQEVISHWPLWLCGLLLFPSTVFFITFFP